MKLLVQNLIRSVMLFVLLIGSVAHPAELPETLDRRTEGFYLSPKPGRVTSEDPLASLSADDITTFMIAHPELKDHRVVIGLPSLLNGKEKIEEVKRALTDLGLPADVDVIRWPNGSVLESALDFFPRKQDWEKPLREEISTGHVMVFGGEALSMSLMVYLVLMKQLSPLLGAASTVLDLAQNALITYPLRFLSNYQRRQTFARQFLFNYLYGVICTTNFFILLNSADLHAAMPKFLATVIPGSFMSAIWSNTAISAYKWEGSTSNRMPLENRRIMRSRLLLMQQLILSPFYIYSISPFAKTLFSISAFGSQILDVNVGHLVIIAAGAAAAAAYPLSDRIARFTSSLAEKPGFAGSCLRLLAKGKGSVQ